MQHTHINSINSIKLNIRFGVHKGSILEPLLILFINDLSNVSNSFKYLVFADGTSLVANHYDINDLVFQINNELVKANI